MDVFQLVYVSSATRPFSESALLNLLERSRRNNERDGITGMLLFRDGNFMQALEGAEAAVRATHARILDDPRHRGAITLLQRAVARRSFEDWSMGFRNLHSAEVREFAGYNELMNVDWFSEDFRESPDQSVHLLESFCRGMR